MAMAPRDVFLATCAALIWGATFPISAIALEQTPPIFFTFLRFLCAAAFIFVVPRPQLGWLKLMTLGVLLGAGQYGSMFFAMSRGIPAGMAAVLVHTQAIFTVLLAIAFLSERPTRRLFLTLGLATTGLVCLLADRAQGGAWLGFLMMIIAALSAAFGNIILKSAGKVEMLSVAVWMSLAPLLPLALLSLTLEGASVPGALLEMISWKTVAAVVYSAVLATVLVYAIWGRLLITYTTAQIAPFFLLVPMFGLGLSALVLGEKASALQLSGSALIFLGLVVSILPTARRYDQH